MNFKSVLSSWFGLGLLIYILQFPFHYIFKLIGMDALQGLVVALAGLTAAMISTYYCHPRIMSPLFKLYAMLTQLCTTMILAAGFILTNSELREFMSGMLQSMYHEGNVRTSIITVSLILVGLLINYAALYLFITLGNKQMVKALEHEAKK